MESQFQELKDLTANLQLRGRESGRRCVLFYTSGTTGVPKGRDAHASQHAVPEHAYFADIDKLGPRDAGAARAPLSHGPASTAAALRRRPR